MISVEPREVLLAKLAGAMAAPMVQFAGLLQDLPRNFAYGLRALIDQGGAPGAPAPADAPAPIEEPLQDEALQDEAEPSPNVTIDDETQPADSSPEPAEETTEEN